MSLPRYYKQRDKFSCGPVAIFNALKWAGAKDGLTAKRALPPLSRLCECSKYNGGTKHTAMDRTLRIAGKRCFDIRRVYTPKLGEIEEHLRAGGALILNFRWHEMRNGKMVDARHYVLITDISLFGEYFGVVNYSSKRPVYQRIHRDTVKKRLMRFRQTPFKAWFLTKV